MRNFETVANLRAYLRDARGDDAVIGFVPTMGALHDGHLALLRRARSECDRVVLSIFVNPTQFAAGEDLDRYPRPLASDSRLAADSGVDALFTPAATEIYPEGFATTIHVSGITERWDGAARPGHFDGVATVCAKLFEIVLPDRAYFGQKDMQQLRTVERLVADLHFPMRIVSVPTVREPDGLAMSSRNAYLGTEDRAAAPTLFRALTAARSLFDGGERSSARLRDAMVETASSSPRVALEYAAIADLQTLEPLETIESQAVALVAARVGPARLIDNTVLGED